MQQTSIFPQEGPQIVMPDADVQYFPYWMEKDVATSLFKMLYEGLQWKQQEIVLFGKRHKSPRLQAWYGDSDAIYRYSGLQMQPLPWHDTLREIKEKCEEKTESRFNSVLANLYRTGADSMGLHADDEPELGSEPVIASVSLGASRNLDFVHNISKEKVRVQLTHGSLLIMKGQTQTYWKHGINKTKRVTMPRINLTFRLITK